MLISISLQALTGSFSTDLARAAKEAKKQTAEIDKAFKGMVGDIAKSIAAVAGPAAIGLLVREAINAADEMGELAKKVGVSAEALSELQYAARQSGVDDLAPSLIVLNKSLVEATKGVGDQAAAFKAMGVAITDAEGKIRGADDVLEDIADRFAGYEDGARKAAIAQAVFGKSGADLIPFLNQGRDGIEELRKECARLGITITSETAAGAHKFNDALGGMTASAHGLVNELAFALIPGLNEVAEKFLDLSRRGELKEFARSSAIGLAYVAESLYAIIKTARAFGGSVEAIVADLNVLDVAAGRLQGTTSSDDLAKALEERNRTLADANARYVDLWSYNATAVSDAIKAGFAEADSALAGFKPTLPNLPTLADLFGGGKKEAPGLPDLGEGALKKAAEEAKKYQESLDAAFKAKLLLQASSATNLELGLDEDSLDEQIQIAGESFEKLEDIKLNLEQDTQDELGRIVQDGAQARIAFHQQEVDTVSGMFGDLAYAASAAGKKGFAAAKAFAIAQTTIDTIRTVQGILASFAGTGPIGFGVGVAASIAAGLAGLARVAQIKSQEAPGYMGGGWTGSGPRDGVAGVVHNEEFVVKAGPAARNRGYLEAINNGAMMPTMGQRPIQIIAGPGIVVEQLGDVVTTRMLPDIERAFDSNQAVRISTGKSATGNAIGRRFGVQGNSTR